eukprot:TRINITY_DN15205_c0_g1_i1.p1 TRINITY_DN15205_c0_g1~~TRINITY_DN15205_c0_g1_i1.p1  ORF type:complete len:219 (+),score=16.64 TRINITY_DN15205_c0_g1_i1:47-658(+)
MTSPAEIAAFRQEYCGTYNGPVSGVNHLALTCSDIQKTLDFYCKGLGFPLVKIIEVDGHGWHLFLDMGGGQALAFFWFAKGKPHAPGVASAISLLKLTTAPGSMNHVALNVASYQALVDYRKQIISRGIKASPIVHHGPEMVTPKLEPTTEFCSVYTHDPDGVMVEFCYTQADLSRTDLHVKVDPRKLGAPDRRAARAKDAKL